MRHHLLIFFLLFLARLGTSQNVLLDNPSFEDRPGPNRAPQGWYDCSYQFPGETPVDVQPSGSWNVTRVAQDGETYVGMVVRENNTWEAISQKLKGVLLKDSSYQFEIMICTSDQYLSATRESAWDGKKYNYTTPAKLVIWGGDKLCDRREILAESGVIKSNRWEKHSFILKPVEDVTCITLEAYYINDEIEPYNGNILIDNASAFVPLKKSEATKNSVKGK